ncbi:MAG: putative Ig domain-containing protein, partial [Synergistaceae bacterium]|nr:putative Ig domain-containing protein [Synergistaceae bacterium]
MKKHFVMFLAVCLLAFSSSAWADYWNEGHSGTEADPYEIDTNADLVSLRDRVNAGTEAADMYYKLTQNLTISQYTNWQAIGTDQNPFKGHFDGNSLAIHINIQNTSPAGLFGTVSTVDDYAVRNLAVSGNVKGRLGSNVSGIILRLNSGSVENCSYNGTLEHTFGGTGVATGSCSGIVAEMAGGAVKNCSSSGNITSEYQYGSYTNIMSGIVARMSGGSVENCTSSMNISQVPSSNAKTYMGGIVGYAQMANFDVIKNCTFSGNVNCKRFAGGIAGYVSGGNLQNNHITGNSNGQSVITGLYASGGIAGRIGDSTVLESCDVSSIVIVEGGKDSTGIGGIVGLMNASTVRGNQSYASISGDVANMGGVVGKLDAASYTISNNRYSSAEHGIGSNAQGVPSEEGCIKAGPSIAITTSSLAQAVAQSPYSAALASDSSTAVVWTLTNGTSLPKGLTLDRNSGRISGSPEKAGTYTFTVKASPVTGAPATKEFTLVVREKGSNPDPVTSTISITTTSLPSGIVGSSYSAALTSNPSGASWSLLSGNLPSGLSISTSGVISGTPERAETSTFTVRAVSGTSRAEKSLSITIAQKSAPSTLTITTTSLPAGTV